MNTNLEGWIRTFLYRIGGRDFVVTILASIFQLGSVWLVVNSGLSEQVIAAWLDTSALVVGGIVMTYLGKKGLETYANGKK